ncbi:protein of unknown function [Legionella hackeliae]|uniref:Uncharacterized protein n=1 Tax=Legionella hackeliae TaxID=449 RepID=A0A0A8URQ2_LEGHA|nr:protein of unknown function [Legionella hackeliae]
MENHEQDITRVASYLGNLSDLPRQISIQVKELAKDIINSDFTKQTAQENLKIH